ncbi:endolytic transglycosylase MltG [Paenibacillus allorhizosphaerae]|uniref:Uncharacterized protein n=1 Tax=Paenibacillus allorhizosphaerae TaxID=2849866 RepID=A0ABN7TEP6_9BACL|nr:endolytic transglycosylase MltG [Paenibacillus allorhizosphaerae]CAG7623797.1 hypothetical protein PAECIP111802_00988 [Paenibacillus allorhizosphaerae]
MRNNKSLLYGLGTGLIIGAILLQLMNAASSAGHTMPVSAVPNATAMDLDQKQIKEAASKYFQVFDKAEKLYTQPQLDSFVQQKLKEEKDKRDAQPSASPKETYIYISKGLVSYQVADVLYQSGVIADRKAFEDEMNKKQLNDKIVSGIHAFKGPQELQQVIAKITAQ